MYFICYPPLTAIATATPSEIYAGNSSQLDISASGGTGDYSYSWISDPVGFVSSVQNPIVNPTATANYTCIVTSGNQIEEASIPVTILVPVWQCGDQFVDPRDGQSYNTVSIGTQCWMAENLNIGTRIDGILNHKDDQTDNGIIEKFCYDNDDLNCDTYGGLYQWNEMMQYTNTEGAQGICPSGWHLPTDDEWKVLEMELGMSQSAADAAVSWKGTDEGTKLKSTSGWQSNGNGNNSSGFTGLPGGWFFFEYTFFYKEYSGFWWTSTQQYSQNAWYHNITYFNSKVRRKDWPKHGGFSVRCVKD